MKRGRVHTLCNISTWAHKTFIFLKQPFCALVKLKSWIFWHAFLLGYVSVILTLLMKSSLEEVSDLTKVMTIVKARPSDSRGGNFVF